MVNRQSLTNFDSVVRSSDQTLTGKTIVKFWLIQAVSGVVLYGACLSTVLAEPSKLSNIVNSSVSNPQYSFAGVYFVNSGSVEKFKLKKSGSRQPLVKAIPVILPPHWQARIKANIDPQLEVSWQAGKDFVRVLKKIAKRNNLCVIIDGQQKKLLIKTPDQLQAANISDNQLTTGSLPVSNVVAELSPTVKVDKNPDVFLQYSAANSVAPSNTVVSNPLTGVAGFFSQLFGADEPNSSLNNSQSAVSSQTQSVNPQVAYQAPETTNFESSNLAQAATAPSPTTPTTSTVNPNSDLSKPAVAAASSVYALKAGQQLSEALRDWCKLAHQETGGEWSLIWEAANDQPIEANSYYGDNIESALEQLQVTIIGNNIPLRVYHWTNHVIKVTN